MFGKIVKWLSNSSLVHFLLSVVLVSGLIFATLYTQRAWDYINHTNNPPVLEDFKNGIQNHLVWDIEGLCYFVRPYTENTVYLVTVPDCNRK